MKEHLESIKQKVRNGAVKQAIDLLANLPEPVPGLEDDLLMLQSRLRRLESAALEGTISRDDEIIERNTITRSLLNLIMALESGDTTVYTEPQREGFKEANTPAREQDPHTPKHRTNSGTMHINPRWLILAGILLFTLVLVWGIGSWRGASTKNDAAPMLPDLTARLVFHPENLNVRQTGLAKIVAGKSVSEALPIPSDGVIRFRNIPAPGPDNPIRLELSDVKYACRVTGQSVPARGTETDLTFYVELDMQTFNGRVIHRNATPAAGVEIEVENGLTRAVSDANGNYSIRLPKWDTETIRLVLRKNGKVLVDRKAGLDDAVLKELKIPES